ncbi:hypothetical protein E2C01_073301 [Portunus trituberculatus]|uniref:Uncharacterized protein n=1 Tax=Portunus trituberculatus TaxID=210409 RepID=A0A5B7I928_PORTR|nr:hypothetical protein [Portunus trituberculatus]
MPMYTKIRKPGNRNLYNSDKITVNSSTLLLHHPPTPPYRTHSAHSAHSTHTATSSHPTPLHPPNHTAAVRPPTSLTPFPPLGKKVR